MVEIRADRDHLRAEFAISTRRLEMTIGRIESENVDAASRTRQEDGRYQSAQERVG